MTLCTDILPDIHVHGTFKRICVNMVAHRDSSLTLPGVLWSKEKPGMAAGSSKPQSGTWLSRGWEQEAAEVTARSISSAPDWAAAAESLCEPPAPGCAGVLKPQRTFHGNLLSAVKSKAQGCERENCTVGRGAVRPGYWWLCGARRSVHRACYTEPEQGGTEQQPLGVCGV